MVRLCPELRRPVIEAVDRTEGLDMAALRNDAGVRHAGVRRRLAFIGQIVISGLRWAMALAEHVHLLLGLALLAAGVTVGGLLLHRPAWFLGIFAAILLLLILGEGAYRVWHEADTRVVQPAADQTDERAEVQLAGAIQSGHVLYSLRNESSPLERQWREETEALVREMAGDLEAARLASDNLSRRLGHLDDLADYARSNAARLTRSGSWDHYVLVMRSFRDCLAIETQEGERIRADPRRRASPVCCSPWSGLPEEERTRASAQCGPSCFALGRERSASIRCIRHGRAVASDCRS
jgi:hypothetical protein